ncbi:hemerythrin [Williamwhitmania taraxaci]|uniref:Hemerythrin n=2 Tax=Williamwhitmania taraxaci TaxID=1640674 RepID=A0A1G6NEF6_9BACT|nr:hemerythrin [Williamwhitmania taraxaci]
MGANFLIKESLMFFIDWDKKYELGIKSIDDDHQKLVALIDELLVALSNGKGRELLAPIIKKVEDYTLYHFRREEFFMKCAKYPNLENHIIEHQHFIEKIKAMKAKSRLNDSTVAIELMKFLKEWLINHIQVSDRKYEAILKKSGVQ